MIARNHQPEAVGDADRTGDFDGSAGVRYIPDGAVDNAAIELDGSCLQYPVPGRGAMVLQNLKRFRCLGLCSLRRLLLHQPLACRVAAWMVSSVSVGLILAQASRK